MENWKPVNPDEYEKPPRNNTAFAVLVSVFLFLGAVGLIGWLALSFLWQVFMTAMRAA